MAGKKKDFFSFDLVIMLKLNSMVCSSHREVMDEKKNKFLCQIGKWGYFEHLSGSEDYFYSL